MKCARHCDVSWIPSACSRGNILFPEFEERAPVGALSFACTGHPDTDDAPISGSPAYQNPLGAFMKADVSRLAA